jgi:hypothetical protein
MNHNKDTVAAPTEELTKQVKEFSYVPTKNSSAYTVAILTEFKKQRS